MEERAGKRAGSEVVQVYVRDMYATITPSIKRLREFERITLEPGASKTVNFELSTRDLAFVGLDLKWKCEKGEFELQVGGMTEKFEVTGDEYFGMQK